MANTRAIKRRIKSVKNTGKITKTMSMVATAKSTRAIGIIRAFRPYRNGLLEVLHRAAGGAMDHPLIAPSSVTGRLVVLITSNRGLCGGYNGNLARLALRGRRPEDTFIAIGKKGAATLRYAGIKTLETRGDFPDIPRYERSAELADRLIQHYLSGNYGEVTVVYMKFLSAGSQKPAQERFLPLTSGEAKPSAGPDPIFAPARALIADELIPKAVRAAMHQILLDAAASEHLARQIAMKSATDNAGEMVRALTLKYNRVRQSQITTEIAEIVGGAEALN